MAAQLTALRLAIAALLILVASTFLRIIYIFPHPRPSRSYSERPKHAAHLLIVLGSGGHTAEMLSMLRGLDIDKYAPRTYVISSGDEFSSSKAAKFERLLREKRKPRPEKINTKNDFEVIMVPRARNIHQSLYTTPLSSLHCFTACFQLLIRRGNTTTPSYITTSPDLIITNGPATGVIMVLASLLVKFCGLQKQGNLKTIYVESWARVKTLSLSGRILHACRLTDRFLVQWKSLETKRAEYRGPLVE